MMAATQTMVFSPILQPVEEHYQPPTGETEQQDEGDECEISHWCVPSSSSRSTPS